MIADIANQEITFRIKNNAVRLAKLCFVCRPAIAAETGLAGSGKRRDTFGFNVYFSNDMIVAFGDKDVARFVKTNFMRSIQAGLNCRTTISFLGALPVSRDQRNSFRAHVESEHAMVTVLAKPHRIVRPDDDTERIVQLRSRGRFIILGSPCDSRSKYRADASRCFLTRRYDQSC